MGLGPGFVPRWRGLSMRGTRPVRGLILGCPLRFHYPRRMYPGEGLCAGQKRSYVTGQVQAGPGSGASSARTVPSMRP